MLSPNPHPPTDEPRGVTYPNLRTFAIENAWGSGYCDLTSRDYIPNAQGPCQGSHGNLCRMSPVKETMAMSATAKLREDRPKWKVQG